MRAIIIEEDRFVDLTDKLQLVRYHTQDANTAERLGVPVNVWKAALEEAHRRYHFEFVRWAQSHGASCVRK